MTKRALSGLLLAAILWPTAISAEVTYGESARILYLRQALEALAASDAKHVENTYRYIDVMDRNACRSAYHRLRTDCLIEAAQRNCRSRRSAKLREACRLYADIIVVNKLSEDTFIPLARRYAIMNSERNFRRALRRELTEHYGTLTTQFTLSRATPCPAGDRECLAAAIDAFCLRYADGANISWHHCSAAVVWFIGTAQSPQP